MYTRQITYYDLDGKPVTVELAFHMNKMQRVKFLNDNPGFVEKFNEARKNFDFNHFYPLLEAIVGYSYGHVKLSVVDGRDHFIPADKIEVIDFLESEAYAEFAAMLLDTSTGIFSEFVRGAMPDGQWDSIETVAEKTRADVLARNPDATDTELVNAQIDAVQKIVEKGGN